MEKPESGLPRGDRGRKEQKFEADLKIAAMTKFYGKNWKNALKVQTEHKENAEAAWLVSCGRRSL